MDQFMSIKEVAEYLGVDYKTVYRLVRKGEIASTQIGRIYRIRRADVDAYLAQQRIGSPTPTPTTASLRCSVCRRLLTAPSDIAGACETTGCSNPICTTCWTRDHRRYCPTHQPTQAERLTKARAALDSGEIPLFVTALQARQREQAFITRFDVKVRGITRLMHPTQHTVLAAPSDWVAHHETEDEAVKLMRLMRTGFIGEEIESAMPLNRVSRFRIPSTDPEVVGLVLEAHVIAHLPALVEEGFDAEPATAEEAIRILDHVVERADQDQAVWLVGLASPTGWSADAQAYVATGEAGRTFYHAQVLPYLVDLAKMCVIYKVDDDRLPPMAPLFAPMLLEEGVARVAAYLDRALTVSSKVAISEIVTETGIDVTTVGQAIKRLVEAGTHTVTKDIGLGQVVRLKS